MKLEIIGKKSNPLLSREEINFKVKDFTSTPSRKDIRAKVAALTNSKDELVVVGKLSQEYGSSEASGEARIYKDKTQMTKTELPHFIERNFNEKKKENKEEPKPAEAAAGEKKESQTEEGKTKETPAEPKEKPEEKPKQAAAEEKTEDRKPEGKTE